MKNEKMKEILDFFRNNKKKTCIGAGAGVAVIAVCVAVGITLGNGAKTTASNTGTQTQTETTTETAETETTLQMPLEENTVPEVTQLITEYYNAAAAGDMDTINSIVNTYDQETQIYLQKMSEHIEAYQNVVCYTKTGPVDGSMLIMKSSLTTWKLQFPASARIWFIPERTEACIFMKAMWRIRSISIWKIFPRRTTSLT